jgi:hypothetical protein
MRRVRDARLSRLAAERTRIASTEGLDECTLRAWSTVRAVVRDGLAGAGIDPACATALRLGEAADMAELNRFEMLQGEEEWAADDHDGLAAEFATRIGAISLRFRDGHTPDFASASLAELLAWCLSRKGSCRA